MEDQGVSRAKHGEEEKSSPPLEILRYAFLEMADDDTTPERADSLIWMPDLARVLAIDDRQVFCDWVARARRRAGLEVIEACDLLSGL